MKEQERAKRLLQFTQRVAYSSDEGETEDEQKQQPPQRETKVEAGELARLGIRPLDSQRYADQLVRDAGLLPDESSRCPTSVDPAAVKTAAEGKNQVRPIAEVIYSASAPGFVRSSRAVAAEDVSAAGPPVSVIDGGDVGALPSALSPSFPDEDDLTGNPEIPTPWLFRNIRTIVACLLGSVAR
jgi:hypothetical protein